MVNQLPQGWKEVKLKDICVLINGRAFKQHELLDSGKYKVLRVGNFFSNNKWYYSDLELDNDKYCNQGDLLFAWSASFGPKIWNDKKTIYHYHIWKVKVNEFVEKKFLYYLLLADSQKIKKSGHGVAMIHITKMDMENRLYTIPTDKDEQEYIVKTLDAVAEMIKLRKETIQLTKDLIPAIFQEMFGDCSENVLIGNNDYFEIEDGDRGNNYPKKEELLEKGDCLFLSAKNVTEDGFVFKENVFISQDKDKKLRTGKLKRHDFVMMTRGTIGNIAYYAPDIPYDNIRINSGMVIIRIKQGFEPLYFLQAMRSDNIKFQINNLITGAAVPQLPIHLIKKISLKLADNTKQKEFAKKVEQINQNLEVQQKDLERLQELFDQLLQKAFTGELTRGETYGKH